MATIGKIAIVMAANASPLQKGLAKAATAVNRWERQSSRDLGRSVRTFKDGFGEVRAAAESLRPKLAVVSRDFRRAGFDLKQTNLRMRSLRPRLDDLGAGLGKMGGAARKAFSPLVGLAAIRLARWASAGASAIGTLAGSLFKVVGILGAVSAGTALAATWIGVRLAKAAIHFDESVGTVRGFFGDTAEEVLDDAKSLQRAAGIGRKEYLDSAAALNELFANTGLADRDTADLSRSFARLAADSAAFRDSDFTAEFDKISRALQGSTRALRAYGIDLSTTAVKEEAVRLGLVKKDQELGAVSDRLARASLIQQGLARDAGELGRAFDSPRNLMAALAGRWEDLKISLGEKLAPKLAGPLTWLNNTLVAIGDKLDVIWDAAEDAFGHAKDKAWEFGQSAMSAFAGSQGFAKTFIDGIATIVDGLERAVVSAKILKTTVETAIRAVQSAAQNRIDIDWDKSPEERRKALGDALDDRALGLDKPWEKIGKDIDKLGKFGDEIRKRGKELAQVDVGKLVTDAVAAAKKAVAEAQEAIVDAAGREARKPRDWQAILDASSEEAGEDKAKKPSQLFGEALTFGSAAAVSSILRSRYGSEKDNPVAKNTRETAQGVKEAVKAINRLRHGGNQLAVADF